MSAFPDRGRRDPAALFALGVLLDAATELDERRLKGDALDATPAGEQTCAKGAHATFLLDAVREGGPRGEKAAACCAVLTRISPAVLCSLVDVATPRLTAAARMANEAQGWEEAAPVVRCAASWRWCLTDGHPAAVATAQFMATIAGQTLPSLHHGAVQRPAASAMVELALGLRAAALEAPLAWHGSTPSASGPAGQTAHACNDLYTCLKTWAKKPHGKAGCLAAMSALMAAAPPPLSDSPQRRKLVQALCQDMASKDEAARLAAMCLAADLLRSVPMAVVSKAKMEWGEDVLSLLTAACGFTGSAKRNLMAPNTSSVGSTAPLPARSQRQALVALLCSVARFDPGACCDAIQRLATSPTHGPRATGLGAAAAVLNAPAAISAGGLDESQRSKAEALLLGVAHVLVPPIKAALAPHTVVGSLPDEAALDAASAAMGCMQLLIPRGSAAAAAAATPPAAAAAVSYADEAVTLLHGFTYGDHPGMTAAARSTLRWCVTRVPNAALVTLLRQCVRCCSCTAHRGSVPPLLSVANASAAAAGWIDALTLMLAALDECAARAGGAPAGAASSASSPPASQSPPSSPGGLLPASAAGLPTGLAWTRIRIACEGVALVALALPVPNAWPLARAVAAACASPMLRDLETGRPVLLPSRDRPGPRTSNSAAAAAAASERSSPTGAAASSPMAGMVLSMDAPGARDFLADALDGAAAQLSYGAVDGAAGDGLPQGAVCAPELVPLLRQTTRPSVAVMWAWRKMHACSPWRHAAPPSDPAAWACQLRFLCAVARVDGDPQASGPRDADTSFATQRSSLDGVMPSGSSSASGQLQHLGSGSVRGSASAAVLAEMMATEGAMWLAKDRMAPAMVQALMAGMWHLLAHGSPAPEYRRAVVAAISTVRPACHELLLQAAAAKPAGSRAVHLDLMAALGASGQSPAVLAALDEALQEYLQSKPNSKDAAFERACAAVVASRLGASATRDGSVTAVLPVKRCALVARVLAAAEPSCEALAALLSAGPLDDAEVTNTVLSRLESVLHSRGAQEPGAVDALVSLMKHAPWTSPGVAALSLRPGAGKAAQPAWLALVSAVTARPHAWVSHAVIMNAAAGSAGGAQSSGARSPLGRGTAATTAALVPSGALVAAAVMHCARDDAVCRAAALDMLQSLSRAFPPADAGSNPLDGSNPLPVPLASMTSSSASDGAPGRVVEAVLLSRSLATVYPHWAPAVMMALVPLAATACALPTTARLDAKPPGSSGEAFMPAAVLVALAGPWAAALPCLLARLATPGAAAAAADMAAAEAAATGGAPPPPPLPLELTPRTMHLDRFLGDSLQAVASQVQFPPAASPGATAAKGGAKAPVQRLDNTPSQARACVCAIAGAALALSDLVTWHDGNGPASLSPLWAAMLTGTAPILCGGGPSAGAAPPEPGARVSAWPVPWVKATARNCEDVAEAVGAFLLDSHCDCSDETDAQARIEAVAPLLVDAPCASTLINVWSSAVRSRESFNDSPGADDDPGKQGAAAPAVAAPPDGAMAMSRSRMDALERSALRLCTAAATSTLGCQHLAPCAPRLLHASLALVPHPSRAKHEVMQQQQQQQQQQQHDVASAPPPLAWLLLRGAMAAGSVPVNVASPLLGHLYMYGTSTSPQWALATDSVPLLRALGAALSSWRPGLRVAWRREAFAWIASASTVATATLPPRGLSPNLREGLLVSLHVCAALARQQPAPRDVLRLARCAVSAGAAGESAIAGAALRALPSAVGVTSPGSAPAARSALSTGAGADAQHYAAATALASLALPPGPALRNALPLAEALLTQIGRAELGNNASGAGPMKRIMDGGGSASQPSAVGDGAPRSSASNAASPFLLAGCAALSRFWFALPGVHTDTVAATMLLRAATLPECAPGAVRLLDALAVAQADTLPADNWLLILALLCAAVEAQTDPAGPVPRARRAVSLLDSCGFALDEVADAFRALLAHDTLSAGRMAPGPATVFAEALSGALALACPAPQLWTFAVSACGRLARFGPLEWRPASLRLAAALLRARSRSWALDVLSQLAEALHRGAPAPADGSDGELTQEGWLSSACASEEAALAAALVACGTSLVAGGEAATTALVQAIVATGETTPTEAGQQPDSEVATSYGATPAENSQLCGYAHAWLRDYITPGLAALPAGAAGNDMSDDAAYFVAPEVQLTSSGSDARLQALATRPSLGQSSSGGRRVTDVQAPAGYHHSPRPSVERLGFDISALLMAAPPAGSDWRVWHAWQQQHNAANGPGGLAPPLAAAAQVTVTTPPRAGRQSSADFDAWHPQQEVGPSTSGDHLWWGGATSRVTVSSIDAYEALPRSVSHASSAALAAQAAAPVDALPRAYGRPHISGLQFPAEEDEDALFQRERFLQQARRRE